MPFDRELKDLMYPLNGGIALLKKILHADSNELHRDRFEVLSGQRDERQIGRHATQGYGGLAAVGVGQSEINERDFESFPLNDFLGFPELSDSPNIVVLIQIAQRLRERCGRVDVVLKQ